MIKKKGRRPKSYYENLKLHEISNNIIDISSNINNGILDNEKIIDDKNIEKIPKKRGRKPKGGKIVEEKKVILNTITIPNIILHLNCKISEIEIEDIIKYDPNINNIDNYDIQSSNNLQYNYIDNNAIVENKNFQNKRTFIINKNNENNVNNENNENNTNNENNKFNDSKELNNNDLNYKLISKKLKEINFNNPNYSINSDAACFWCTCCFKNESIFIPKYELNNVYYCYGNFCSPQCAASFLMNENIDTSTKFERYYLLNNIYGNIFNFKNNIKLAPNPYYLLNKYFGNLTIEEYRKLLENEKVILTVNKPITKIFPDIYEENIDFLNNSKIGNRIKK